MLKTLTIRSFVLIDELTIDFSDGLSVITGETGAGKSIILGAIALLMGQRADNSAIRPGAERCIIEASFSDVDNAVRAILASEDIEPDEDDLIIRREISVKGKSRAFVNDTPASLTLLKQLSEYLINIHSQHKNLLLGDAHFQLSVLDLYSGNEATRRAYTESYQAYQEAERALQDAQLKAQEVLREADYLQFQFDQLESASLQAGEVSALEEEETRLTHALDIKTGLARAHTALDSDDGGVLSILAVAIDGISSIRRYYPEAEELYARLSSAKIELGDIAHTIDNDQEGIEYDPKRLDEVIARLDLINSLLKKHGVETTEALLEIQQSLSDQLLFTQDSVEQLAHLEAERTRLLESAERLANTLRAERLKVAKTIELRLVESLHQLGMPHVRLLIDIKEREALGPSGRDHVTFLFSANKDIKPEPVAEIASGGEISRLMLSIKALIADRRRLPTIIFDEIDTGVSGDIAERIGNILAQMGRSMQVMAVTHLPQIAATGTTHYYIYKEHGEVSTSSHIRCLNESERIEEIARMQSGSDLSEITLAAARELLSKAQGKR